MAFRRRGRRSFRRSRRGGFMSRRRRGRVGGRKGIRGGFRM